MRSKVNLHVYQSSFTNESRILRETRSLVRSGAVGSVLVAALHEDGLPEEEALDERRKVLRFRCHTPPLLGRRLGRGLRILGWMARIYWGLRRQPIDLVNCHSLPVLPLGVLFKLRRGARLIYDAHELETEMGHWSPLAKSAGKLVERLCIRFADEVIVVSDLIGEWYRRRYALDNVHVVRNKPDMKAGAASRIFRERLGIPDEHLVFLFQGRLTSGRNVEMLLRIFSRLDRSRHLVCMGFGPLEAQVRDCAARCPNIHFHPGVPVEALGEHTSSADVGLSLTDGKCLNHLYSLPNKVYEYLASGIAVIVSDFPEMGRLVDQYACGWKTALEERCIEDLLRGISREAVVEKRSRISGIRHEFTWAAEEERLLEVYGRLGPVGEARRPLAAVREEVT